MGCRTPACTFPACTGPCLAGHTRGCACKRHTSEHHCLFPLQGHLTSPGLQLTGLFSAMLTGWGWVRGPMTKGPTQSHHYAWNKTIWARLCSCLPPLLERIVSLLLGDLCPEFLTWLALLQLLSLLRHHSPWSPSWAQSVRSLHFLLHPSWSLE